jgi:hypothetical protein
MTIRGVYWLYSVFVFAHILRVGVSAKTVRGLSAKFTLHFFIHS